MIGWLIGAITAAIAAGWGLSRQRSNHKEAKSYEQTRKKADKAGIPSDPDSALDWLRRRNPDKR